MFYTLKEIFQYEINIIGIRK